MIPTLKIGQVANGFIVYPPEDIKNIDGEQTYVFQTFKELVFFLSERFDHRGHAIALDPKPN